MRKKFLFSLLTIIALGMFSGCRSLPSPYQHPSDAVTMPERQKIYDQRYVSRTFFWGLHIGGRVMPFHPGEFPGYYDASGDSTSARIAEGFDLSRLAGLAAGLGGLATGLVLWHNGNANDLSPLWISGGAGLISKMIIIGWGNGHYFDPAAKSFNAYLKRDLGLPKRT